MAEAKEPKKPVAAKDVDVVEAQAVSAGEVLGETGKTTVLSNGTTVYTF